MKSKTVIAFLLGIGLVVLAGSAAILSQSDKSNWPELSSVTELKERFKQDKDAVRIVLLLSPT
jgi:hypothetical protein